MGRLRAVPRIGMQLAESIVRDLAHHKPLLLRSIMFISRRFLGLFAASTLCILASPHLRSAAASSDECADGMAVGAWKLPMTSGGHGAFIGRMIDPDGRRVSLRIRAELTDEPGPCLTCVQGSIHGFIDDGQGGPPRYAVEGTYEGPMSGTGHFDLRVVPLRGGTTIGEFHGEFDSPRALGFRGRFRADWRIC
jgi:hypothetical protein